MFKVGDRVRVARIVHIGPGDTEYFQLTGAVSEDSVMLTVRLDDGRERLFHSIELDLVEE